MKYSEFLQLNEVVETKGTTLFKELGLETINEAGEDTTVEEKPETIDTEKGHWFSKWGRLKSTLNKQGKKMQDQINKKVLAKYLPPLLKNEVDGINQINDLLAKNTPVKDILDVVSKYMDKSSNIQEKQMNIIEGVINKFLDNAGTRLDKRIEDSKMKEKNKIDLKNYWLLLKTQIKMNALSYMNKTLTDNSKRALGDNPKAQVILDQVNKIQGEKKTGLKSLIRRKYAEAKDFVTKQRKVVTDAEAEMKSQPAVDTTAEQKLAVGTKLNLKDEKTDKEYPVEIIGVETNKIKYKTEDGKEWSLTPERFKELFTKPVETTSQTPEEKEKARQGGGKVETKL